MARKNNVRCPICVDYSVEVEQYVDFAYRSFPGSKEPKASKGM